MNNLSNTSGIRLAFDELRHRRPFGDQPFWRRPSWDSKFVLGERLASSSQGVSVPPGSMRGARGHMQEPAPD